MKKAWLGIISATLILSAGFCNTAIAAEPKATDIKAACMKGWNSGEEQQTDQMKDFGDRFCTCVADNMTKYFKPTTQNASEVEQAKNDLGSICAGNAGLTYMAVVKENTDPVAVEKYCKDLYAGISGTEESAADKKMTESFCSCSSSKLVTLLGQNLGDDKNKTEMMKIAEACQPDKTATTTN